MASIVFDSAEKVMMTTVKAPDVAGGFHFDLPPALEATEPAEVRGSGRDDVRLMVSSASQSKVVHTHFRELASFLKAGDALVINTSATRPAAIPATRGNGMSVLLHLSTELPAGLWLVELRRPAGRAHKPFFKGEAGETLLLPAGGCVTLHRPYGGEKRLWIASLSLPENVNSYLAQHGQPIRYSYVKEAWPLAYYQTVYATEPGSAEMPSAGRPFTPELITALAAKGVQVLPLLLHTGVASQEAHEKPYAEYYRVPAATARALNGVRAAQGRVVSVGTTVVRALETVADDLGEVHPGEGWTNLIIAPETRLRVVDGLLTGLHEPRASHLAMLQALAGSEHVQRAYEEALRERYLWHEFGDSHLLLR
jgi:S-adenosylmethionine:tRNA ribosyltransferase-isomerase